MCDTSYVEQTRSKGVDLTQYMVILEPWYRASPFITAMCAPCLNQRNVFLYFFVLSTLTVYISCRAVQSNVSLSTYNRNESLQLSLLGTEVHVFRRALTFGAHQFSIPGTGFSFTLNVKNSIPTSSMNPAMVLAQKILDDASSLNDNENIGQAYNVWPAPDRIIKFELRRLQPLVHVPILGRRLLEVVGQMIKTSFHDIEYNYHFAGFNGKISFFGQERFSFRAFALPASIALAEKVAGVEFGAQDLDAIFSIKLALLSLTTTDDLLIFVGNTGR